MCSSNVSKTPRCEPSTQCLLAHDTSLLAGRCATAAGPPCSALVGSGLRQRPLLVGPWPVVACSRITFTLARRAVCLDTREWANFFVHAIVEAGKDDGAWQHDLLLAVRGAVEGASSAANHASRDALDGEVATALAASQGMIDGKLQVLAGTVSALKQPTCSKLNEVRSSAP